MIAFIEGEIARLTPTGVIVLAGGLGYDIAITLPDYSLLREEKRCRLWITEIITDDAYRLFGFLSEEAQLFFDKLRSVSGVGPATARLILSSFSPAELAAAINGGAVEVLQTVKGIGLKTAQRIVVDLKGKIVLSEEMDGSGASASGQTAKMYEEACGALKTLGFPDTAVRKAVRKVLDANAALPVEQVIKEALRHLS